MMGLTETYFWFELSDGREDGVLDMVGRGVEVSKVVVVGT